MGRKGLESIENVGTWLACPATHSNDARVGLRAMHIPIFSAGRIPIDTPHCWSYNRIMVEGESQERRGFFIRGRHRGCQLKEAAMTLSGPKKDWWWYSLLIWAGVILGIVGILAELIPIAALANYAFWLLAIGWLLLAVWAALGYFKLFKP